MTNDAADRAIHMSDYIIPMLLHSTSSSLFVDVPLRRVLSVLHQQQISPDAGPSHVGGYGATRLADASP